MGRSLTIPPKIAPSKLTIVNIATLKSDKKKSKNGSDNLPSRSKFTPFDDKIAASNFLLPTESLLCRKSAPYSPKERQEEAFIKHLRDYDAGQGDVPYRPQRRRSSQPNRSQSSFHSNSNANSSQIIKPFPDNLRHLIREDDADLTSLSQPSHRNSKFNNTDNFDLDDFQNMSIASDNYFVREEIDEESRKMRRLDVDPTFIASIIDDYKKLKGSTAQSISSKAEESDSNRPENVADSNIEDSLFIVRKENESASKKPSNSYYYEDEGDDDASDVTMPSIQEGGVMKGYPDLPALSVLSPIPTSQGDPWQSEEPPAKAASSTTYALDLSGLTSSTAVAREHHVTDLRTDRRRSLQMRVDRLLAPPPGPGALPEDSFLSSDEPKGITNSYSSHSPAVRSQGQAEIPRSGSPSKSVPLLIPRKSVILGRSEVMEVLVKGFAATKVRLRPFVCMDSFHVTLI